MDGSVQEETPVLLKRPPSEDTDSMISSVVADDEEVIGDVTIEALVAEYRDVRDDLAEQRHAYQTYEANAKERMDEIAMKLREIADSLGLNALPTNAGTAYRTLKESYRVGAWDKTLAWMQETGNWQVLEKRVAKLATKEIHQATGVVPPGIDYSAEVEFVVRKNSK